MSQRIADASAKAARSFYPLLRMTDNVLSVSFGQLAGLSGEVVQHSNVMKSFSSYSARQHQEGKIWPMGFIAQGCERFYDALFDGLREKGY
jgi:hypothetical protein